MTDQTAQPQPTAGDHPSAPTPGWTPPAEPKPTPASAPVTGGAAAKAPRRRSWVDILLVIGAVVALAGIGFAVGRLTAPTTAGLGQRGQFLGNGQFGANGQNGAGLAGGARGFFGGGSLALTGKVTEVAADHLTLEVGNGSTVTIATDGSTTYHQQAAGSPSDVRTGDSVIVQVQRGAAAGAAGASPAPGQGGFTLGSAQDVTVTAP
jgi:hypothetical protein